MNCTEDEHRVSRNKHEKAPLKPFNWNLVFPKLEDPYRKIDLTWVNSAKTDELLTDPEKLLDRSGLGIILKLIDHALGDKLKGCYVDFGTIAGKTSFTNVVNDLLLLYGETWDNLSDFIKAYKTVFSCLRDEGRMIYLHGAFFRAPEKAQFIYSKCIENHIDTDIAEKLKEFENATNQDKELKKLDENYFTPWTGTSRNEGFVGVIPVDVPDLSVETESEDIQALRDNHSFCHKLFHATLLGKQDTIFVSIPVVGTSSGHGKTSHLSGQGAIFLLLMLKDGSDASEKELTDLSSNISSFCKDMFLPYLHDASMGMVNEALRNSAKAAVAAVMSRNGSHNLGSHVIYNVIKDIDRLNVQDNRLIFKYLQQRMDFLAQVSTDWVPEWSSSSWLVHEIIRGFLEQAHLLSYIGKSEGLQMNPHRTGAAVFARTIRPITNVIYKIDCGVNTRSKKIVIEVDFSQTEKSGQPEDNELRNDILIAVPGGLIGFHALYTIFENFIRNAAKHEFATLPDQYKEKTHLQISFEIEEDQNRPCYKCRIWDNLSYISHIPADNLKKTREGIDKSKDLKIDEEFNFGLPQDGKLKALRIIANCNSYMVESETISEQDLLSKCNGSRDMWAIVHPFDKSNGHWQERTLELLPRLIRLPNVGLVPESKFIRFTNSLNSINTNMWPGRFKDFLADIWHPLHVKMNGNLREALIKYDGTLKKGNWGLSEIKICAAYLTAAQDIWSVAKALDPDEEAFIKTTPVEDIWNTQDQPNGNVRAYRLGFNFYLNKPKEVLIVGLQIDSEKVKGLGRYGVFVASDLSDDGDYDFEFVVVIGDAIQTLISKMVEHPDFLEKMPYRLIAATSREIYLTIPEDYLKRIAHCDEAKLSQDIDKFSELPVGDFTSTLIESFKTKTYEVWVHHLKNTIRTIQKKLYLVVQPFGSETPDSERSLFKDFFEKAAVEYGTEKFPLTLEKAFVAALRSTYGFHDKSHRPATLPKGLSSKRVALEKLTTASFDFGLDVNGENISKLIDFLDHSMGEEYYRQSISYLRHKKLSTELANAKAVADASDNIKQITSANGLIYEEPLGGGSAHFPILASLCNLRESSPNYYKKLILRLIENALLTVAVADERFWDFVSGDDEKGKILNGCGVYPVEQVINYGAEKGYGNSGTLPVLRIVEGDKENSLKITGIEPVPCGVVIHQGILDKINWESTNCGNVEGFIVALRKMIPFVVITSGRGKPHKLPAKFLGFSHIENYLLSDPHSKLLFSDVFMRLILPNPSEEMNEE